MTDRQALQRRLDTLQRSNEQLLQRAVNAEQVMAAFARGEIDAVALGASETPVLLKAAQAKLRNSQQLLRAIFDGALEPMVLIDGDGKYLDANPAACALYALPLAQLVGRSMSEFTGIDREDEAAYRGFRERSELRGTFALQRADGTRRIVEFSWVSNVAVGLDLSVMRDITDRVAAEVAVQRSEARFRTLTEKSADVIALVARDGNLLYMSPSVTQMLGWTPEEMIGADRVNYVLPEDGPSVRAAHERLLRDAGEICFEFRALHRDGTLRWIEAYGRNLLADPNVGAIVENLRDVSARVQAEERSRESHHRLEEAQAIAHVGSWALGLSDGQVWLSREAARIFGAPEQEPLSLASFLEIVHVDDRERFRRASQGVLREGDRAEIEHRIQRADGSVRWVHERGVVERDALGQPIRMVGTVQDVTDHRLAVEALRTGEEEFRLLAEAVPQIVWITRPDGWNIYFNQHWVDHTGLSLEESRGHGWNKPFHPDDRQRAVQAWQDATTTVGTYSLECRLRRKDGVYHWWLIRGVPVRDASGAIVKWFGTCTDVDALKQGEERLRVLHTVAEVMLTQVDSREAVTAALRVLGQHLRAARCAYAIVAADGEHCDVMRDYTDGCVSMEGRHRLLQLGARVVTDLSSQREPIAVCDVDTELGRKSILQPLGVRAFVCCSLIAQGAVRALLVVHHASPRGWTAGEISIVQEVLDRCWAALEKSAAAAKLRENEALLRIAGRAARLGGWSVALPDFRLTWSEEVCAIHEVPAGTVPSMEQAIAYYAPEFREIIRDKISLCLSDGTPFDLELQIVTATGRRVWVRAIGNPERNAAGAITILRGAFQDIDDRRKLQDQYRQAQKMEAVGRLAGGVAHDFNNILSVILSYSELAIDSLKRGDPLREDIEEIRSAGQRATGLTRQLLAFSRQQVLEPRVIDLSEVIGGMKPMLCRLLGEDVEVTVLTPEHVGRVLADPSQIEQVVMNLAVNARDAMPEGGKLTIETSNVNIDETYVGKHTGLPQGRFVMLTLADSGAGMTEATLARAFEPFFTTKAKGKGTGLGLATVFGIMQQSGGYVTVDSAPNQGTTFKVYLPRTDRAPAATVSLAPSSGLGGSETILLVEDEDQVRSVACTVLRRHGYVVLDASNGGEAFLISSDYPESIDLLLTDVIMPRMNGRRLAEQLILQRPEMKVLFASGYTDDAITQHGVLDAGVAFLQKPFTPKVLLKKVRDALDGRPERR